ncbi:MAG TPA: putative metal-dependent hydrolase [Candidatus Krumholzibacteria bacterium]
MSDPRYPIGEFKNPAAFTPADIRRALDHIAECPKHLRAAVARLDDAQLDTPYREGGWTVRQVVHHVADSHVNAYIRCKLAVAENHPRVTAYDQDDWVKFADVRGPVAVSLGMVEALHERWVAFLRSLPDAAFHRTLDHPENGTMTLANVVFLYEWHGLHHVAHITSLRQRQGW